MTAGEGPTKIRSLPLEEPHVQARWTEVLWSVVKEYTASTTLHGYRYLTEPGRHWIERLAWLVVEVAAAWGATYMILAVWQQYLASPTVTMVESTHHPVWEVPFPGIALCNINRISRARAEALARALERLLAARGWAGSDARGLERRLRMLGRLYEPSAAVDEGELERLDDELRAAYGDDYEIEEVMRAISPTCEDLLSHCRWRGRNVNCSKLFELRTTNDGFCCTFNYLRYADNFPSDEALLELMKTPLKPRRLHATGYKMGLTVVVDPQPWDYYYPLLPFYGVKVMVFRPRDFADTTAGGALEQLVTINTDVFMRLDSVTLKSTDAVRSFSLEQRRCLFESEVADFYGYYSYPECLTDCRAWSIRALCGCLSFFIPKRGAFPDCGPRDVACMGRYTSKWHSLRPPAILPGLKIEHHEALECHMCLPACDDTTYVVQTTYADLRPDAEVGGESAVNRSVINIFYGTPDTVLLRHDELFSWMDLLSYFGGVCGLFVGFSLISVVEAVYFFTVRLFLACRRSARPVTPPSSPSGASAHAPDFAHAHAHARVLALARVHAPPSQGPKADLYWHEMGCDRF